MASTSGQGSLPSPPESSAENDKKQDSTTEDSTTGDSTAPPKGATGEYLEDLSKQILEVTLNQRDNMHPLVVQHMSPAFRGKHDALPKTNTRDDHQQNLKKHLETQPNFRVEILNHSSDVDDSRGRGTVFLWYKISGLEGGLGREAVAVLSWERKQNNWMIIKHSGMRGPSGFS
ncbi:uncharacterized protein LTR77_002585 [Saxophila tyrrhenica]|uniref:SnoaL-like domain-containing protein n=1 Tax=Saxophila tyrrhenica TaxID=1690608 RepID=A0AAV9PJX6_9PEZI|nr:hypothetical protein LTR77_002585 [Saxophila tyrrhenica]